MTSDNTGCDQQFVRAAVADFEGPLTAYAARLLGDVDRARDVVQETFLRLCRQQRSRVEPHLAQWLFTVCRNRSLDEKRKEGRMSPLHDPVMENCRSSEAPPPDVIERQESCARVLRLLEGLSENQQEVIRLKFQSGLSYREISGVTGLSVSNVGYLIHTGLKTIRSLLADSATAPANS